MCRLDADGSRALATLRWGLVPSWAKDRRRGARLINARAETVHDMPSFRAAFRARRCLVPANGWFEWHRTAHATQSYFLALADGSPVSFTGLWEDWARGGDSLASFTIITTATSPRGSHQAHECRPRFRVAASDQLSRSTGSALRRLCRSPTACRHVSASAREPSGHTGWSARSMPRAWSSRTSASSANRASADRRASSTVGDDAGALAMTATPCRQSQRK